MAGNKVDPRRDVSIERGDRPGMKRADIAEFFRRLAAERPAPETELDYVNPFTLLVAVVLSAQATDAGVNKARNIIKLCEMLIAEHGGVVPAEREKLERLPGVGRKTASVVLNVAFGE